MKGPRTRGHIPRACLDSGFISALRCLQTNTHRAGAWAGPGREHCYTGLEGWHLTLGGFMCRWKKTRSNLSTILTCGCHDTVGTEDTLSYSSRTSESAPALAFSRSWSMDGQPFAHPATEVVLDIIMRRTSRIVAVARGRTNAARHVCLSVRRTTRVRRRSQKQNFLDGLTCVFEGSCSRIPSFTIGI